MSEFSDVVPSASAVPIHSQAQSNGLKDLAKCLWTHNPFYLISVALVLHSTRLWHHDSPEMFSPWPLMSIIGGYLALVSVTGFLLIKLGRVWDDARSIFFVILLLFVELSLLFDSILIRDVGTGTKLLLIAWSAAVAVSEGLLIGLRIRLPWRYRGPYHLLLALMFLYPLVIVAGYFGGESVVWRIFWFSPCVALALLLLVPAVHRGRADLIQNGTPWRWPWYPWTLFGFLTICLSLRAWALTLSFDPVTSQGLFESTRLQGTFGGYSLIPIVLALGVLLFETGVVERRRRLQLVGLVAPILCAILALPSAGGSAPYLEFRGQFTDRFGSPLWVTLIICWIFYAYGLMRGAKEAVAGLMAAAIALMVFGRVWPGSLHLVWLPALPLLATAGCVMLWSWHRRDSRIFVAGLLGVYLAGRDMTIDIGSPLVREAAWWNMACLGILVSGLLFQDRATKYWKQIGSLLVAINCAFAAVMPPIFEWSVPYGAPLSYCVAATLLTAAYAWVTGLMQCRLAALGCLVIAASRLMLDSADLLKKTFHWDGALYFMVGLGMFVVAVVISALKSTRSSLSPPPTPAGEVVQPTM